MRHLWWLFLVLGLISILVGLLAISSKWIVALLSVIVFGVLLLIAGVTELIHAVMVRNGKGFAVHLLTAALYLLVGLFMLEDPVRAAKVLTLLLAASFFVGGLLRIVTAIAMQFPAWPWVVLHGGVDLLLGILILPAAQDPESSLWVIGLFVGLDLLFHGWSWVVLALNLQKYGAAQSA
jgi:uncharacterized membrane protein HdeD (DUF308 family)